LASIDALGQYQDSGFLVNDLANPDPNILWSSNIISQKADLSVPVIVNNIANIDALGQYKDSSYRVDDSAVASASVLWTSLKINSSSTKLNVFGNFNSIIIPSNSSQTLSATATLNPGGFFSLNTFTAPRTSFYNVSAQLNVSDGSMSGPIKYMQLNLVCSGGGGTRGFRTATDNNGFISIGGNAVLSMTLGETLIFRILNFTNLSKTVTDPGLLSFFMISEL
jgi:hypothetical protein